MSMWINVGVDAYSIVVYIESLVGPMIFRMVDSVQTVISYVLTKYIGVYGVFLSLTIGSMISMVVAFVLWRRCKRYLNRK